jgi:hypothetical protein
MKSNHLSILFEIFKTKTKKGEGIMMSTDFFNILHSQSIDDGDEDLSNLDNRNDDYIIGDKYSTTAPQPPPKPPKPISNILSKIASKASQSISNQISTTSSSSASNSNNSSPAHAKSNENLNY